MEVSYIRDYLELREGFDFVDLRTPKEFAEGTIGHAINVPVFSDDERSEIGTVYKKQSVEKAKKMAIEAVSKRLPEIYEHITKAYKKNPNLALFCARGGMRSNTLGSLLNAMGYKVFVVNEGYKGYRNRVIERTNEIAEKVKFVVIHGNTGVGKTKILKELSARGEQILDIEGLARHRGSMLGKVGISEEINQKQFEHELFEALDSLESPDTKPVFVEAESRRLGGIVIPDGLFKGIKGSPYHINTYASMNIRVENILDDYILDESCANEIIEILPRFAKFIGNSKVEELQNLVKSGEFGEVVRFLMENHYDPKYEHPKYDYLMELNADDLSKVVEELRSISLEG